MGKQLEWRQREVIEAVRAEVAEVLETGGKVVEVDARRRLLVIHEPEFGRGYRRVLALYRLTSALIQSSSEIAVEIGIPKGEKGDSYGFFIEVGSRTAPAHPWLRPALLTNLQAIMGLFNQ